MEYFQLTVRTGVPAYVDAGGGVHIEGFPQVVSLRKMSPFSMLMQKLFGDKTTDRRDIKRETNVKVFSDEFMVEVPLDVDVSAITGVKNRTVARLKIARPQDIDEHVCGEVV